MKEENLEVTENAQLEAGKHYHCFCKHTFQHQIHECKSDEDGGLFLGSRIWATDNNNQALEKWVIYGPIAPPNIGGMFLCPDHGGVGFRSDCMRCEFLGVYRNE